MRVNAWLAHVRALAKDIGPRGSTTPGERAAAEYAASVLSDLGLAPYLEPFISAVSGYELHLLVAVGMLLAFVIYAQGGQVARVIAAVVAGISLASEVLELMFMDNPLRRLMRRGHSQNVVATLPPVSQHRQDLVIIGHLDTNRTPLIFTSTFWIDVWRILTPLIFASFCVQTPLYILGAFTGWPWIWPATIPSAVMAVILLAITVQAETTGYSPGANDNATGAALVLALAEHLVDEPLQHTRVWLVNTGCEEVKHYGAIDFFKRHKEALHNPQALVFEMLGRDGPAYMEREVIIPPFSYQADPALVALLKRVADAAPDLTVHPTRVTGGHSEMADALRVGIPAITLIGIGPEGTPIGYKGPDLLWHKKTDTVDRIDHAVLARTYPLVWAFIRALDAEMHSENLSHTAEIV